MRGPPTTNVTLRPWTPKGIARFVPQKTRLMSGGAISVESEGHAVPAVVNSELQKAATKTVILEMSDAPVMVVDPPAARSTEDAIVISTATASSTGVGVGDTVVHINDPGPIAWDEEQLNNLPRSSGTRVRKRVDLECAISLTKTTLKQLNRGAFQFFLTIHQTKPLPISPDLLQAIDGLFTVGRQIAGLLYLTNGELNTILELIFNIAAPSQ
ncbi:hypothetical protein MMC21_008267 [Puttea exsequens]|nr:hypothetical protein [Puttea exsequens]